MYARLCGGTVPSPTLSEHDIHLETVKYQIGRTKAELLAPYQLVERRSDLLNQRAVPPFPRL
jgi:hypothetical protein